MERTVGFEKRCLRQLLIVPKKGSESPQAGIQNPSLSARGWGWIPACAGMTNGGAGMTKGDAGMTNGGAGTQEAGAGKGRMSAAMLTSKAGAYELDAETEEWLERIRQ